MCQTYFQKILYDKKSKYIIYRVYNLKKIYEFNLKNNKFVGEMSFVIS